MDYRMLAEYAPEVTPEDASVAVAKARERASEEAEREHAIIAALRASFERRLEQSRKLCQEGVLNEYWRGNAAALEVCLDQLDVVKEENRC